MSTKQSNDTVEKLLTFVFENNAPIPTDVERCNLTDDIFLAPLPSFLLEMDKDFHLLAIDPDFSAFFQDHLHKTTLNIAYRGNCGANYEGARSDEQKARDKIDRYLLAGMVNDPSFVVPYALFATVPSEERVCQSHRMHDYGPLREGESNLLTEHDFQAINAFYDAITKVYEQTAIGRLPIALRYYQQAFRTDIDGPMRFLGMMSALEAIMLSGNGELAHRVSERTAFFLRNDSDKRQSLYDDVKRWYGIRSAIAHGNLTKKTPRQINKNFAPLLQILWECLAKILDDPDLISFFSGNNEFEDGMKHMIFHGTIALPSQAGQDTV